MARRTCAEDVSISAEQQACHRGGSDEGGGWERRVLGLYTTPARTPPTRDRVRLSRGWGSMPTLPIAPLVSGSRHRERLRSFGLSADKSGSGDVDTGAHATNNAGAAITAAPFSKTLERKPCSATGISREPRDKSTLETMPAVSIELKAFTARQFGAVRAYPRLEGGTSTAPAAALAREGVKGSPPTGSESVTNSAGQPAVGETSRQAKDEESAEGSTHYSAAATFTETDVSARKAEGLFLDSTRQSRAASSRARSSSSCASFSSEAATSAEALAQSPRATDETATAVAAASASQGLSAFSSLFHARSPDNIDGAGFFSHIAPPPSLRRALSANSEMKSEDFMIDWNLFNDELCKGNIDDGMIDGHVQGKVEYESKRSTGDSDQGATANKNLGIRGRGKRKGKESASTSGWDRSEARFCCGDAGWEECRQEGTKSTREDHVIDQINNNDRRRVAALFADDDDDGDGGRGMNSPLRWSTGGAVDVSDGEKNASGFRSPGVSRKGDDDHKREVHGRRNSCVVGGDGGGDGHRTPPRATSRSSSGSPGLTPLRGRSRRGWWRRRRDSYPTET